MSVAFITCNAQNNWSDSIKIAMEENPKFYLALHNRNTIVHAYTTKLYGLIGGVDYNKKFKIFVGLYGLSNQKKITYLENPNFQYDTVYRSLATNNISIGAEYTYCSKNRIRFSLPVQIGIGNTTYKYSNNHNTFKTEEYVSIPLETGTNAYYELINWIGLKGGVGYRVVLGPKKARQLSSPYYNLGVSILIGELYHQLLNR